jgi:hypothetical protein
MFYFPVGARMTYTAKIGAGTTGFSSVDSIVSKVRNDLQSNLSGQEELDVETVQTDVTLLGPSTVIMTILNNGVDHGDENDARSIVDSVFQNYTNLIGSSVTKVTQPLDPNDGSTTSSPLATGADSSFRAGITAAPSIWDNLLSSAGLSTSSKLITGLVVVIIAIVALALLLPGGFIQLARGARR